MNRFTYRLLAVLALAAAPSGWSQSAGDNFKLEEGYVRLFNGKDLSGWEYGAVPPVKKPPPREKLEGKTETSDGVFLVKDELLVASGKKIKALYTTKEFNKDFHLKFEFRASADKPRDNSGLFIRGPQLQLDATNEKGSLTGVFRNIKNFKVGDWNEIDVTVKGMEATCLCNGQPIMKKPMRIPATGTIGLQSEYGRFEFRRIRIKELPSDGEETDSKEKLSIYFNETGMRDGRALDSSMRFGLVVIDKNPKDNGKKLMYDQFGASNSTVVQIDNTTRRFGSGGDGAWKVMAAETGSEWKGKKSTFLFNEQIYVTQLVELVPGDLIEVNPGEFKRFLDTCRVRYTIENNDKKDHTVGLRIMIDTLIGKDDGVPFIVPGQNRLIDGPTSFDANAEDGKVIPAFIQVLESRDLKNPGLVGFFNLKLGSGVQAPTRVSLTHWNQLKMWDWEIPIAPIAEDSAVVLYWKEKKLKPGQKREVGFTYGLGNVSAKKGQLAIAIGGVKQPGQELTVTALVQGLKEGDTLTLKLPDGLKLKEGGEDEQAIPKQAKQAQVPVTWTIQATHNGTFDIQVTTSTGVTQKKRIVVKTTKPL